MFKKVLLALALARTLASENLRKGWSRLDWIKIKKAAEICKKPERTLRHYAILGKIKSRKDGRDWLLDTDSLKKLGWLAENDSAPKAAPPRTSDERNETGNRDGRGLDEPRKKFDDRGDSRGEDRDDSRSGRAGERQEGRYNDRDDRRRGERFGDREDRDRVGADDKQAKYLDVKSLGIYQELLGFRRSELCARLNKEIQAEIEGVLFNAAVGFYEFNYVNKLLSYREARKRLIRALVHLHILEVEKNDDVAQSLSKIMSVLPGLKGLIRRTELKADGRTRRRSQGDAQGREPSD